MPRNIRIHTGNILHLADLKRKPGHTPADELRDSLKIQLSQTWSADGNQEILAPLELSLLNPEDRSSQKITVKLFLSAINTQYIKDALDAALQELGTDRADLFIISWPAGINTETSKDLWNTMESLVETDKAYSLGISDIEPQAFIELHQLAKIKPEAIQINLESCCVVPPELVTFTREHNIQLLTHNDPHNLLPADTLRSIISTLSDVYWTVRYQTLLRCRGIIQNKGYVISASTE